MLLDRERESREHEAAILATGAPRQCFELARLEGLLIALRDEYTDEHPRIRILKSRILDLFDTLTDQRDGNFVFRCPPIAPIEPPTRSLHQGLLDPVSAWDEDPGIYFRPEPLRKLLLHDIQKQLADALEAGRVARCRHPALLERMLADLRASVGEEHPRVQIVKDAIQELKTSPAWADCFR
jgi:hypothetical protein